MPHPVTPREKGSIILPPLPNDPAEIVKTVLKQVLVQGAINLAQRLPQILRERRRRLGCIEVELNEPDLVLALVRYLANHDPRRRHDRFVAIMGQGFDLDDTGPTQARPAGAAEERVGPPVSVAPAPTREGYPFTYRGTRMALEMIQEPSRRNISGHWIEFNDRKYLLRAWTKDASICAALLGEAITEAAVARKGHVSVYVFTEWDHWYEMTTERGRPMESVVLADGLAEAIEEDLRRFLSRETWYRDVGIPYRRGYLFYGPPGCGKTSFVRALAAQAGMDLYWLSLSSDFMDDGKLLHAFTQTKPRSIILLEDIDAAFTERRAGPDQKSGVSFSGLLNTLDGVASQEGRIVIMTTNHRERLDPALTRDGRVDAGFHFDLATQQQARRLFLRFFPGQHAASDAFAAAIPNHAVSPAEIQNYLIDRQDDVALAAGQAPSVFNHQTHKAA